MKAVVDRRVFLGSAVAVGVGSIGAVSAGGLLPASAEVFKRLFLKFLAPVLVLMLALGALMGVMEKGNAGATGLVMFAVLITSYAVFKIMKRNLMG
jgi:hypothetical protein